MNDDILDEIAEQSEYSFWFYNASLTDAYGNWEWWSATQIVRIRISDHYILHGSGFGNAGLPIDGVITNDLDSVESGLNETHGRYESDWCPNKPLPIRVSHFSDLLMPVTEENWARFRIGRDKHRIANGLPRYVVRSDFHSKTAGARLPLYALRHPWPAGTFMQGGRKSVPVLATPEQVADPGVHTSVWESDGLHHAIVDDGVFLEGFPPETDRAPSTFMRTEARTFAEAEDAMWIRYERTLGCPSPTGDHEYEARTYKNGAGFCKHCNVFGSRVFTPEEIGCLCIVCGIGTFWSSIGDGPDAVMVCKAHCPPSFSDLSAAVRHEDDEEHGVDPESLARFRATLPTDAVWESLDFTSRWALVTTFRRAEAKRMIGHPA
jgi:hypothetical protein